MVAIRNKFFVLLFISIIVIASVYFFETFSPRDEKEKAVEEQLKEELEVQLETEDDMEEKPEEIEGEEIEETIKEDPVRDYLAEKWQRARDLFIGNQIHIVTLGDSLTEGVGDETEGGGYVGILDSVINDEKTIAHFHNFAKRGSRSDQLQKRLEEEDVQEQVKNAQIIFITIGANDVMQVFKENFTNLKLQQFTSEQELYEQRIEAIFEQLRTLNEEASIYLIGFYNPFQAVFPEIAELEYIVESWNQIGSDVTERFPNAYFIPIKDIFDYTADIYLAEDQFHPNYLGYKKMAERILTHVLEKGDGHGEQQERGG